MNLYDTRILPLTSFGLQGYPQAGPRHRKAPKQTKDKTALYNRGWYVHYPVLKPLQLNQARSNGIYLFFHGTTL